MVCCRSFRFRNLKSIQRTIWNKFHRENNQTSTCIWKNDMKLRMQCTYKKKNIWIFFNHIIVIQGPGVLVKLRQILKPVKCHAIINDTVLSARLFSKMENNAFYQKLTRKPQNTKSYKRFSPSCSDFYSCLNNEEVAVYRFFDSQSISTILVDQSRPWHC